MQTLVLGQIPEPFERLHYTFKTRIQYIKKYS
jgi:hypothetical protein